MILNKKGIEPNYFVEITKDDFEKNNDSQLNFAKNMLKNPNRKTKACRGAAKVYSSFLALSAPILRLPKPYFFSILSPGF